MHRELTDISLFIMAVIISDTKSMANIAFIYFFELLVYLAPSTNVTYHLFTNDQIPGFGSSLHCNWISLSVLCETRAWSSYSTSR